MTEEARKIEAMPAAHARVARTAGLLSVMALLLGGALLVAGLLSSAWIPAFADRLYPDRLGYVDQARLDGLIDRVRVLAVLWSVLGLAGLVLRGRIARLAAALPMRNAPRLASASTAPRTIPVVLVAAALALRVAALGLPLRFDEAFTYLRYASRPLPVALSVYSAPNNHLLHTGLVWLSTSAFGASEWAIRLPAVLAGVALVWAVYTTGAALVGPTAAVVAAAATAGWPYLVDFSTNARGYTLAALFLTLQVDRTLRLARAPDLRDAVWWGVLTALGLWTIPTYLLFLPGLVVWWIFEARPKEPATSLRPPPASLAAAALASAVALVATLLVYTPPLAVSGPAALTTNEFVAASSTGVAAMFRGVFAAPWQAWTADLGVPAALVLGAATVAGLLRASPLVFLWCGALLPVALTQAPPDRVFLPLLPCVLVTAGAGVGALLDAVRRMRGLVGDAATTAPSLASIAVAAALLIALALHQLTGGSLGRADGTGRVPAVRAAAEHLSPQLHPGDAVAAHTPVSRPLEYYLGRGGFQGPVGDVGKAADHAARLWVVVDSAGQDLPTVLAQAGVEAARPLELHGEIGGLRLYATPAVP